VVLHYCRSSKLVTGIEENKKTRPCAHGAYVLVRETDNKFKISESRGAWLAQLVEQAALDLRDVSLSPTWGVEITTGRQAGRGKQKRVCVKSQRFCFEEEKEACQSSNSS